MSYLKLILTATQRALEVREAVVRLGRDPASTIAFSGEDGKVVSAHHAELRHSADGWRLVDLGSRNGTYLNGIRVSGDVPLKPGDEFSLGERGPRLSVAAVAEALGETVAELPRPPAERPPEARAYAVTLLAAATGKRYEARGTRIRIGRGLECEIRPVDTADTVVSRVHAELAVGPGGGLSVRDAGSRNGTFVNGERVREPMPVRLGDKIMLGPGGPVLLVEGLGTAPLAAVPRPGPSSMPKEGMGQKTVMGLISDALAKAREERKRGHRGSTAFLKAVAEEVGKDSRRKLRWLSVSIVVLVLVLGGGVSVVYWLLSSQVQQSEAARLTAEDSARAEAARLRDALAEARRAAAPEAQVDSLRTQLEAAQVRTGQLQASLERAQSALGQQLQEGETRRAASQQEVQRLRDELAASERRAPSQTAVDSLRRAVAQAESQTASLDARMRAVRGTDFASIAQQNQGAVGLITVAFGHDYYNGTGFVITPDGYMLTNWHVVADSTHPRADTIWVTMADQSSSRYADVVTTSQDRDIALIKIRGYQAGPYLTSIDWTGSKARQGEPAALIGYPAGAGFAHLRSSVIRTSMTAGIISRVTEDVMQFDGMTIGGSSGSPLFNAAGQVISIHRAGLPQAPGFALSVPIKHAVPLFPLEVRQRLGIQ
ncbi:MAG TPA: FHA domain-containing protein [Gemmatimonadales bacterium]|nr:FHA domain-containing protein [Gemmatimonadales bacterium]